MFASVSLQFRFSGARNTKKQKKTVKIRSEYFFLFISLIITQNAKYTEKTCKK